MPTAAPTAAVVVDDERLLSPRRPLRGGYGEAPTEGGVAVVARFRPFNLAEESAEQPGLSPQSAKLFEKVLVLRGQCQCLRNQLSGRYQRRRSERYFGV